MSNFFDNQLLVRRLLGISEEFVDPPAKQVLGRAQQSVARALLRMKFDCDWGLELGITEDAGCDTEFLLQLCDDTSKGDRPLFWVLAHIPARIHADYTVRYAIYSLAIEQHISVRILHVPRELVPFWDLEGRITQLEYEPEAIFDVLPMIRVHPSIRPILFGRKRVAAARDHLWLDWSLNEGMKPAAIRNRWNGMSDEERLTAAPTCSKKLGGRSFDKAKALEVVEKALLKATKERAAESE